MTPNGLSWQACAQHEACISSQCRWCSAAEAWQRGMGGHLQGQELPVAAVQVRDKPEGGPCQEQAAVLYAEASCVCRTCALHVASEQ